MLHFSFTRLVRFLLSCRAKVTPFSSVRASQTAVCLAATATGGDRFGSAVSIRRLGGKQLAFESNSNILMLSLSHG